MGIWAQSRAGRLSLVAAAGLALGAPLAGPALGQDQALVKLGAQLWKDGAPCRGCHGSFADGVADIPQLNGPSLRGLELTPEQVAEVIRCGRPGMGMPYFDRFSYTDDRCYGATAEDLGDQLPPKGSPDISPRQVNALVAFVFANFVGKPPRPTEEECIAFWGEGASTCARYRPGADPMAAPVDLGSH